MKHASTNATPERTMMETCLQSDCKDTREHGNAVVRSLHEQRTNMHATTNKRHSSFEGRCDTSNVAINHVCKNVVATLLTLRFITCANRDTPQAVVMVVPISTCAIRELNSKTVPELPTYQSVHAKVVATLLSLHFYSFVQRVYVRVEIMRAHNPTGSVATT